MHIELTSTSVNQMANRITEAFPQQGKPAVLEMLAYGLGYRNFDTLSGVLKKEKAARKQTQTNGVPLGLLSTPVALWLECFSVDKGMDSPQWVAYSLTTMNLTFILEQQAICIAKDLDAVKFSEEPTSYDQGFFVADIPSWSMFVSKTSFWFRGIPKHCDYAVETTLIEIARVITLLKERTEGTKDFRWIGSQLYHDGQNAAALWEMTHAGDVEPEFSQLESWAQSVYGVVFGDCSASNQDVYIKEYLAVCLLSEDDVAEWVGLHYHKNYQAESVAAKACWTKRYVDCHAE
ncbi:MAG: hypothetical protein Q7S87_01320 [Agitococcus sp.]|nr:hypothetical protein [Agitococcus sp.]MDO9179166.1 hypothetical protein [Agitococcus sp.]